MQVLAHSKDEGIQVLEQHASESKEVLFLL